MSNTSATGGFLLPDNTSVPLEDDALINFLQEWIVGITGIAGANVRPRWQPEPPNIPEASVNWIAFGIARRETDTFAAEIHLESPAPHDQIRRHEVLHLLASFYGPNASLYGTRLREGMQVAQNRGILTLNNMGLIESGELQTVPELVKEKWVYKLDLPFSIKRQIVLNYGVLDLASALGTLNNEHYVTALVN